MKLVSKLAIATGVAAGLGAVAVSMLKKRQREEVYHEAEMKAMDELDKLVEQECTDCESCVCAEECSALPGEANPPIDEDAPEAAEAPAEETAEAPVEAPAEETAEDEKPAE